MIALQITSFEHPKSEPPNSPDHADISSAINTTLAITVIALVSDRGRLSRFLLFLMDLKQRTEGVQVCSCLEIFRWTLAIHVEGHPR